MFFFLRLAFDISVPSSQISEHSSTPFQKPAGSDRQSRALSPTCFPDFSEYFFALKCFSLFLIIAANTACR